MSGFNVISVVPHGRRDVSCPMYHVVLRRPGHRPLDLYLTIAECREYGIDVPNLAVVR